MFLSEQFKPSQKELDNGITKQEITFSFLTHDQNGNEVEDFIGDHKHGAAVLEEYQSKILDPLGLDVKTIDAEPEYRILANTYYFTELANILTEEQVNAGVTFDEW